MPTKEKKQKPSGHVKVGWEMNVHICRTLSMMAEIRAPRCSWPRRSGPFRRLKRSSGGRVILSARRVGVSVH